MAMVDNHQKQNGVPVEIESTDRWVAGKGEPELLADLKVYLARLRDDPRSLLDRLRVAAIQLRLGRVQEALIHYEGVLRGYVADGQVLSAIALCERILHLYPSLPRIQRVLAALYARAPRGVIGAPSAVTPIQSTEDDVPTSTFLQDGGSVNLHAFGRGGGEPVFTETDEDPFSRRGRELLDSNEDCRPTIPMDIPTEPEDEDMPTPNEASYRRADEGVQPILLTQPKERRPAEARGAGAEEAGVMLLNKPKRRQ